MWPTPLSKLLAPLKNAVVYTVLGIVLAIISYQGYTIHTQNSEIHDLQEKVKNAKFGVVEGEVMCKVEKRTAETEGMGNSLSSIIANEFPGQVDATKKALEDEKNMKAVKPKTSKSSSAKPSPTKISDVKVIEAPALSVESIKEPSKQISASTVAKLQRYAVAHDAFIDSI